MFSETKMANDVMSFRSFIEEMKAVTKGGKRQPVRAGKHVYASQTARSFAQKLTANQLAAKRSHAGINITTLAGVTRLMSRDNQELLRLISKEDVHSVAELAFKTKRAESNLSRTLKKLASIGVLQLLPGVGRAKVPRLAVTSFKVDIDVISGSVTVVSAEKVEQSSRTAKTTKVGKAARVKAIHKTSTSTVVS